VRGLLRHGRLLLLLLLLLLALLLLLLLLLLLRHGLLLLLLLVVRGRRLRLLVLLVLLVLLLLLVVVRRRCRRRRRRAIVVFAPRQRRRRARVHPRHVRPLAPYPDVNPPGRPGRHDVLPRAGAARRRRPAPAARRRRQLLPPVSPARGLQRVVPLLLLAVVVPVPPAPLRQVGPQLRLEPVERAVEVGGVHQQQVVRLVRELHLLLAPLEEAVLAGAAQGHELDVPALLALDELGVGAWRQGRLLGFGGVGVGRGRRCCCSLGVLGGRRGGRLGRGAARGAPLAVLSSAPALAGCRRRVAVCLARCCCCRC